MRINIPNNYSKKQRKLIKEALTIKAPLIKGKEIIKKQPKIINNSSLIPEDNYEIFKEAIIYFESIGLNPILIRASLSVKIQLEKKVRNLITFRLPRRVGNSIVGSLYFNCVKLENDIVKLAIYDFDVSKDSVGSYKIKRITLKEMLSLLTKERIELLRIIAFRLDNEFRNNCKK